MCKLIILHCALIKPKWCNGFTVTEARAPLGWGRGAASVESHQAPGVQRGRKCQAWIGNERNWKPCPSPDAGETGQTNNLGSQGLSSRVWSSPARKSRRNKLESSEQTQGDLTVCHGNISLRPVGLSPTKCNPVSQGRMQDFYLYIKWPECTGGQCSESKNCLSLRLLFFSLRRLIGLFKLQLV